MRAYLPALFLMLSGFPAGLAQFSYPPVAVSSSPAITSINGQTAANGSLTLTAAQLSADTAGAAAAVAPAETRRADSFSGADFSAQINACNAYMEANGGGICDDRMFSGAQTYATEINIGAANTNNTVVHLFPEVMHWYCSITDGVSSCVRVFNGGVVLTDNPGDGASRAVIDTASGAMLDSVLGTDNTQSGGIYARVGGLSLQNAGNASLANGLAHFQNLDDESDISRVFVNNSFGNAIIMEGLGCGASFHQIQGYASPGYPGDSNAKADYGLGGIPLTVRNQASAACFQAIAIYDSTFNAPKSGSYNIYVSGTQSGLLFSNVYMEGNGAADTTTPMVYVAAGTGSVKFEGGGTNAYCSSSCPQKYEFENHTTNYFSVSGLGRAAYSSWVNDVANGTVPSPPLMGTSGDYTTGSSPSYFKALSAGAISATSTTVPSIFTDGIVIGSSTAPQLARLTLSQDATGSSSCAFLVRGQYGTTYFDGCAFDFETSTSIATAVNYGTGTTKIWDGVVQTKEQIASPYVIAASATPTINLANGSLQTITLNTNASPSLSGLVAGVRFTLEICNPSGYKWNPPAAMHGAISSATIAAMPAGTCALQSFDSFNGTSLVAENGGITAVNP